MPKVEDGPKGLNDLLERAFTGCMSGKGATEAKCSAVAWTVAENAGWHKDREGKWVKKSIFKGVLGRTYTSDCEDEG